MSLTKLTGGEDVDPYQGEKEGYLREVGHHAVWSLSSCKPGNSLIMPLMVRSGYTSGYGRIAWGTIRPDTDK